ncbi:MAG: rod shape-determining protein MreD [Christensenellaceae bacterium]|nr:rod shape-determining protein MreD [Christensenellaceae bacterium]
MRKYVIAIAFAIAFILDSMVFNSIKIFGISPDTTMAVVVSLAILISAPIPTAIGIGMGIFIDILFNTCLGLNSICMLLGALAGGLFYNKYYADNPIVPAVTAAFAVFVKEHIMLFASLLMGRNLSSYLMLLVSHILPSLLITGGLCALAHLALKATLFKPLWHRDVDDR